MKKSALILAGAIAFDLGVIVVSSHAAPDSDYMKYKMSDVLVSSYSFLKFDAVNTPQACVAKGGKTITQNGTQGCQIPIKADVALSSFQFLKFDAVNTPQACVAKGGKTVAQNGVQGCQLPVKGDTNRATGSPAIAK